MRVRRGDSATAPPLLGQGAALRPRPPETIGGTGGCSSFRQAGYLTVSEVAKALGVGVTTLRRREGNIYPRATRIGGIRVYHEADIELLRRRDTVPPRVTGGK